MPKFARPNSYNGRQGNPSFTGSIRCATQQEVDAAQSDELAVSPATLAGAIGSVIPPASTTVVGISRLATNAEAVAGLLSTNVVINPASLSARLAAPGTIGGTTPAAGTFTQLTATTGNITATLGNFVGSASGAGLLLNSPTASGAAASPVVVNGRSGAAVFTSVSIAAAADLTLTITNSAITEASTQVLYSLQGATTGSALQIKSVTNSAGSSAIVITNGTGATTSTADITLVFLVLN